MIEEACAYVLDNMDKKAQIAYTVDMILGCAMTFYVWRVVEAIRQCSQFKKAKRALQKETVQ